MATRMGRAAVRDGTAGTAEGTAERRHLGCGSGGSRTGRPADGLPHGTEGRGIHRRSAWLRPQRGPAANTIASVRITVLAVGRLRPPFVDDIQHYQRLLAGHCRLELIEVKETERVHKRIPDRAFLSLLDDQGTAYDSVKFSRFLEDRRQSGRDLCFVVGGPYGLELDKVDHRLSLGAMTLPHQLARVVLLEQLFRAHKILAGEPYHH
jgi:23S rRNA (pseudouridine1915-N3)-methyltransferase